MKRAWIVLCAQSEAVFTATAATLGGHAALSHVPGATLLGWAASRLYARFGQEKSYTAFHSGKLRFGDGWPITRSGAPAFPVPQCWRERKRTKGGIVENSDCLRIGKVLNYQHVADFAPSEVFQEQAETIKNCFVAADGTVARPEHGWRAKTAITPGDRRAAPSQFFAYDTIRSRSQFAALLEADDDAGDVFDDVSAEFKAAWSSGRELRLGRSKASEFGAFSVDLPDLTEVPWSNNTSTGSLTIWCLSDVCLEDPDGSACLEPTAANLGLPPDCTLDRRRSFIANRRYAPFNAWLGLPDAERAVIAAGSVVTFANVSDIDGFARAAAGGVGRFRETGLGRVWVNPPCLASATPVFSSETKPIFNHQIASAPSNWHNHSNAGENLKVWARAALDSAGASERIRRTANKWKVELDVLLGNLAATPSGSQWGRVAKACTQEPINLQNALLAAPYGVCCKGAWVERAPVDEPNTLHEWMKRKLADPSLATTDQVEALRLVAETARKDARLREQRR